jgi:nicotinamidase/pyrazinamidase
LNQKLTLSNSDALLVTDMQIDFLPGGALPVTNADELILVINSYIKRFKSTSHVIASRDWHPSNHTSFKEQGGPWPPHCVQNTTGAQFSPDLKLPSETLVISKATDPTREAYSIFDGTTLEDELRKMGVKRLFVAGVATDYCVVNTVLDARKLGLETVVLMDATLGIDVNPGDVDRAVDVIIKSGAQQATTADFQTDEDKLPLGEELSEALAEKVLERADRKQHAKLRPKGANKRIPREH